jgi:LPS export ABC transporter protein LptC
MQRTLLVLVIISVMLFPGCGRKKDVLPRSDGTITTPYQEFDSTSVTSYSGPYKRWRLDSEYMRKPLEDTGKMIVAPVLLTIYDTVGRPASKVIADSGNTTPQVDVLTVWGNVLIRTSDSLTIKSEKLWWIRSTHKIHSNVFVQIETAKGDVMRGTGLLAEEDFSRFTFKSNAYTRVPDFKRRVEQDDTSFLK